MTSDLWIAALASEIGSLAPEIQHLILQDAREAMDDVAESDILSLLGDPISYAANATAAFTPDSGTDAPQAQIGPVTVDFRGLTNATVRSRIWNPANPRVFTNKVFGIGWDINLGAIAVKLGLIRPDDYDEETVRAIPPAVTNASTAYPVILSAVVIIRSIFGVRQGRSKSAALGHIMLAAVPTVWSRRALPQTEDALVRNAIASAAATLAVGETLTRNNKDRNNVKAAIAGITLFLQLLLPVRAGRAALWQQRGHHHE